jgi:hypothetical protein
MSANIKASTDGTQAIIGVGGVDQMTVSNAGVVTANSFVGLNGSSVTATGSTTARTLANRFADIVNVKDFGAVGDGVTDDALAFQSAITSLPASGGIITIPTGNYYLSVNPISGTTGARSIRYDISEGATFTGPFGSGGTVSNAGKFPSCLTNGEIVPVGQFIQSRSLVRTRAQDASAVLAVEAYDGNASDEIGRIGIFAGAQLKGSNASYSIASAANFLAQANAGSSGNIWGLEINIGTNTSSGTQFGLSINGAGGFNPTFGIKIETKDTTRYQFGVAVRNSIVGISVETTTGLENAALFGTPPVRYSGNLIQCTQASNSGSVLLLQRNTNTSPSGYYILGINADNTSNMFSVDVLGQTFTNNLSRGYNVVTTSTYSIQNTDTHIVAFYSGTCTITLPTPSLTNKGREISVRTITANPVISNSSNVGPVAGGLPTTAILSGVAGKWCLLVCDGTSWQIQNAN